MRRDRLYTAICLAGLLGLASLTQALGEPVCRPKLDLQNAHLSKMQPTTLQRKWTAVVLVDASACAANASGSFDLGFRRLQEIGPDAVFRDRQTWHAPSVNVKLDFWANEAVARYWIENVSACECAGH